MLFDIEVRPPHGGGQPYREIGVEALTHQDAVAKIQRQNPGCQVWCCNSYNEKRSSSSQSSGGGNTIDFDFGTTGSFWGDFITWIVTLWILFSGMQFAYNWLMQKTPDLNTSGVNQTLRLDAK